jgi:hypothetical protein
LLDTDPEQGLDPFTLADRQEHFGPNLFSAKRGRGPLVRFLLQFHQPLIYTLLAAAIVTGVFKELVDALVILAVVVVNAVVGFLQESKAMGVIAALARGLPNEATVLRSGRRLRVSAAELVPGDIVSLQSSDKVPADLRLLKVRDLRIDESALTGESVPSDKTDELMPQTAGLADRRNMAYSSTLVTYGVGTGVVVAKGDRSEICQISELIAGTEVLDTPLMRKIKDLSRILCVVIIALAAASGGHDSDAKRKRGKRKRGGVQLSFPMFQLFVVVVLNAPFLAPGLRRGNVAFTVSSGVHAGVRYTQVPVAQPSVAASSRRRRGVPAGARGGRLPTRAPSALDGPTPASSADGSPASPPAPAVPPRRAVPTAAPDSPTATARPAAPIEPATRCAPRTDRP